VAFAFCPIYPNRHVQSGSDEFLGRGPVALRKLFAEMFEDLWEQRIVVLPMDAGRKRSRQGRRRRRKDTRGWR
jgi:hypothetical protein